MSAVPPPLQMTIVARTGYRAVQKRVPRQRSVRSARGGAERAVRGHHAASRAGASHVLADDAFKCFPRDLFQAILPCFGTSTLVCLLRKTSPARCSTARLARMKRRKTSTRCACCAPTDPITASTSVVARAQLFCADIFRRFGRDAMQSAKGATPGLKGSCLVPKPPH